MQRKKYTAYTSFENIQHKFARGYIQNHYDNIFAQELNALQQQ